MTIQSEWWNEDYKEYLASLPSASKKCADCTYWTGNPGNMPTDLVCAVNVPKPSLAELEHKDGRKAYAMHDCIDWAAKK